jgi:hypothetical protein
MEGRSAATARPLTAARTSAAAKEKAFIGKDPRSKKRAGDLEPDKKEQRDRNRSDQ